MLLSEAIRRGSKMCREAHGHWSQDGDGCALVAAMLGAGIITDPTHFGLGRGVLLEKFRILGGWETLECCASLGKMECSLENKIMHLTDVHGWSRERIAGWIEANHEVPTYSMLQMQEYMGEPVMALAVVEARK